MRPLSQSNRALGRPMLKVSVNLQSAVCFAPNAQFLSHLGTWKALFRGVGGVTLSKVTDFHPLPPSGCGVPHSLSSMKKRRMIIPSLIHAINHRWASGGITMSITFSTVTTSVNSNFRDTARSQQSGHPPGSHFQRSPHALCSFFVCMNSRSLEGTTPHPHFRNRLPLFFHSFDTKYDLMGPHPGAPERSIFPV